MLVEINGAVRIHIQPVNGEAPGTIHNKLGNMEYVLALNTLEILDAETYIKVANFTLESGDDTTYEFVGSW